MAIQGFSGFNGVSEKEEVPGRRQWDGLISLLPGENAFKRLQAVTQVVLADLEYEKNVSARYLDIFCPKATAIFIQVADSFHYLHANRVGEGILQRSIVASQAPNKREEALFWRYLFDNPSLVVDLTSPADWASNSDKDAFTEESFYPKQSPFWVSFGQKIGVAVKLLEESSSFSIYQVENLRTKEIKELKCLHFSQWPDHGVVTVRELQELVEKVENLCSDPNAPLLIHCFAGVGRTGCLITALALKEKILSKEISSEDNLEERLANLILAFREQRGPQFVMTEEQFCLVRDYGIVLLRDCSLKKF